jgi:hypothetical protein
MGLLSSLFGGSKSRTVNNPSTVWGGQAPFLTNLYGQAQGLAGQQAGQGMGLFSGGGGGQQFAGGGMVGNMGIYGPSTGFYGPGGSSGGIGQGGGMAGNMGIYPGQQAGGGIGQDAANLSQGLLGGLGPYANAATNPAFQNLLQRAQGGSPYLGQQIQGLGADIGQFFNQQILPGIQGQYGTGGTLGGSRQSIAQGMASQDALRMFSQGATNLRQADYGQGLQAAGYLGDLGQQQIGNLGNLYNLGMSPYQAQFAPWQALSGIIGGPAVLGGGGTSRMTDQSGIFQPV